jgi:hypothetical protein
MKLRRKGSRKQDVHIGELGDPPSLKLRRAKVAWKNILPERWVSGLNQSRGFGTKLPYHKRFLIILERWVSGLNQQFAKLPYGKLYRGFESPSLRKTNKIRRVHLSFARSSFWDHDRTEWGRNPLYHYSTSLYSFKFLSSDLLLTKNFSYTCFLLL